MEISKIKLCLSDELCKKMLYLKKLEIIFITLNNFD